MLECRFCFVWFPKSEFPSIHSYGYKCKFCRNQYCRDNYNKSAQERNRLYYQENKEKIKSNMKTLYWDDPSKKKEYQKQYRFKNLEKIRQYDRDRWEYTSIRAEKSREYQKAHKKEINALRRKRYAENVSYRQRVIGYVHVRNARKLGLPSTLTQEEWEDIVRVYGGACAYCKEENIVLEQDHVIPVVMGGGYTKDNIVPACKSCNCSKGTKTAEEFNGGR